MIGIRNKLEEMARLIHKYNTSYYNKNISLVSDSEYDQLYSTYQKLSEAHPEIIIKHSPTQSVGAEMNQHFIKANHISPMLSLSNAFSAEDIKDFIERVKKMLKINFFPEILCEPKIDGVSFSLMYKDGNLSQGLTRGNGITGEIITKNIKMVNSIPQNISVKDPTEIRGEIFIEKEEFKKLNSQQERDGLKIFSNPRNVASGSLRHLDSNITKNRNLKYFVYALGNSNIHNIQSQKELLAFFTREGFQVNPMQKLCNNIADIITFYKELRDARSYLPYEIDGVVYKVNNFSYQARLGTIARSPRFAIAHKFPAIIGTTKLKDIIIQVGRTGILTPVAILAPINIGGVSVARATLHNHMEIERKDIRIGDYVLLERAGDVIPKVRGVDINNRLHHLEKFTFPITCPSCASLVEFENLLARCPNNISCPAQKYQELCHFISKKALDIDGLGKKQLEFFIDHGYVKNHIDIFNLPNMDAANLMSLKDAEGFGDKSITNLFNSIQAAKNVALSRFIYALGIRHIGEATAQILARQYNNPDNFLDKMLKIAEGDMEELALLDQIDGIGAKMIEAITTIFHNKDNIVLIEHLIQILNIESYEDVLSDSIFAGTIVVFSGAMESFSRTECKNIAENVGARVANQVSKNTDFLIVGNSPGSKLKKARELDVKVIEEEEWKSMI